MEIGYVRVYHREEGWGVIDGKSVPGGCWVSFSAIDADGYKELHEGQRVCFSYETGEQDGFGFRALQVKVDGES